MRFRTACLLSAALTLTARAQDSNDAWRADIRQAFDVPHRIRALNTQLWSTFSPAPGVLADRITYATADGMLVPAIVYRPDPKLIPAHTQLPGIVIVNGHGSDKFGWYAFYSGIVFAKAGAVVLTYDPIGEGERNAQRLSMQSPSPHDKDVIPPAPLPHDDWGRRLAGLMQSDLYQAVTYLDSRPDVDSKRIATLGYSMGAFIAGIEGAYDSRVHAVLLSGGGTYDDDTGYFDLNKNPCQGPPYRALKPSLTLDGKPARGFILFHLNAKRGPMLVMNGTDDTVMDIPHHNTAWFDAMHTRLEEACGPDRSISCANIFTSIMYPGVSHRPSWLNRDSFHWLNAQLHFPIWSTNALIDAQGTTHISEWISANKVAISKNYFREDREGGIDAIGSDIPALPRASLMVLPPADWQRLEPQLTYKSWAAKTLVAEQAAAEQLAKPTSLPTHENAVH